LSEVRDFWETCDETFAHIKIDEWLGNYAELTEKWENQFITKLNDFFPLNGSMITEYGCGGSYLGVYLKDKYNVSKYRAMDIADRQLKESKNNLDKLNDLDYELIRVDNLIDDSNDVFICQAAIQHFPNQQYLDSFMERLNKNKYKFCVLQIRYSPVTWFSPKDYKGMSVTRMCNTNERYISKKMDNYEIVWKSGIYKDTDYQFFIFKNKCGSDF